MLTSAESTSSSSVMESGLSSDGPHLDVLEGFHPTKLDLIDQQALPLAGGHSNINHLLPLMQTVRTMKLWQYLLPFAHQVSGGDDEDAGDDGCTWPPPTPGKNRQKSLW